jgi:hypothetical protein
MSQLPDFTDKRWHDALEELQPLSQHQKKSLKQKKITRKEPPTLEEQKNLYSKECELHERCKTANCTLASDA